MEPFKYVLNIKYVWPQTTNANYKFEQPNHREMLEYAWWIKRFKRFPVCMCEIETTNASPIACEMKTKRNINCIPLQPILWQCSFFKLSFPMWSSYVVYHSLIGIFVRRDIRSEKRTEWRRDEIKEIEVKSMRKMKSWWSIQRTELYRSNIEFC